MLMVSTRLRLNPCCGGRCSSTNLVCVDSFPKRAVLILVVVEDVLVREFAGFVTPNDELS